MFPAEAPHEEGGGDELRAAVFDPLSEALQGRTRLLLAPDGNLTRLPFEVLPHEDGGLLIDRYRISYVSTGRDVLRFGQSAGVSHSTPLVVANPDFDLASPADSAPSEPPGWYRRRLAGGRLHFQPLPGTESEGEAIARLLGVKPLLGRSALEGPFKELCHSPSILHLATHGFFLEDQRDDLRRRDGKAGWRGRGRIRCCAGPVPACANIFLAGGRPPEQAEDGLLTAEDVAAMDLLGTELVVLSACATGLGEVRTGEGVFGLQRAFVLAVQRRW